MSSVTVGVAVAASACEGGETRLAALAVENWLAFIYTCTDMHVKSQCWRTARFHSVGNVALVGVVLAALLAV